MPTCSQIWRGLELYRDEKPICKELTKEEELCKSNENMKREAWSQEGTVMKKDREEDDECNALQINVKDTKNVE